jgi:hypothetical protein
MRILRRTLLTAAIVLGTIAVVACVSSFLDVTGIDESKRCARNIWKSQWPRYLGCAIGAHEGLAGGLIGAVGIIWAGWLAYAAAQAQIAANREAYQQQQDEERDRIQQRRLAAKETAVVCLTYPIHAAAVTLYLTRQALLLTTPSASDVERNNAKIQGCIDVLSSTLDNFAVRDAARDLGDEDRQQYLMIVTRLAAIVNISKTLASTVQLQQHLQNMESTLMQLHKYFAPFDQRLAAVFARDSQTSAAPQVLAAEGQRPFIPS